MSSESKHSFHNFFRVIGTNCPSLVSLTIAYKGQSQTYDDQKPTQLSAGCGNTDNSSSSLAAEHEGAKLPQPQNRLLQDFGPTSHSSSISALLGCTKLKNVVLFNFGQGCGEVGDVILLLKNLKCLEYIYHKEVPNSLVQIDREILGDVVNEERKQQRENLGEQRNFGGGLNCPQDRLGLTRLHLFYKLGCYGEQRTYLCSSYLESIVRLCPNIRDLVLVAPGDTEFIYKNLRLNRLLILEVRLADSL